MSLRMFGPLSQKDAGMMNALQLAYIGDAVWETIIRDALIHRGLNVHHMHSACVKYVNAHAQAVFITSMLNILNEQESEIVRRGRNAHAHHPSPKNQNPEDYAAATGFEALIGYLYLIGNEERVIDLAGKIIGGEKDG